MYLMEQFLKGGFWMWPILGVSLAGVAIFLERYLTLYVRYKLDGDGFVRAVVGSIDARQYHRAIEICNQKPMHPLARVLKSGLVKANRSDKEIQRSMEEEMLRVVPGINKRIDSLNMLSNIATLVGLLGTIFGLITAFEGVGLADAATKQQVLAKGISAAMLTTAWGLIVAIPLIVMFNQLQNRANSWIEFIQESAVTVLNHVSAVNREMLSPEPKKVAKLY